jgi:hypothetical protein
MQEIAANYVCKTCFCHKMHILKQGNSINFGGALMPSFIPHYIIGRRILEKYSLSYSDFILGNILPDADDGTDDGHARSHFRAKINGTYERYSNIEAFEEKYRASFDESLILGYYCHLLSDTIWRRKKYEKSADTEEAFFKNSHSASFSKPLLAYYNLGGPGQLAVPESILITEIDKKNIPLMIDAFSRQFEKEAEGEPDRIVFDSMLQCIESAVELCVESINIHSRHWKAST